MTATRLRAVPWVVGVGLVAGTLLGADRLLHPAAAPANPPPAGSPPADAAGWVTGGTVVHGVVDSDPPVARVGPPAVGPVAVVKKVLVRDGDEVAVGRPLVQFDDAIPREKLAQAEAGLAGARQVLAKADLQKKAHPSLVDQQKLAVKLADENHRDAVEGLRVGRERFDRAAALERALPGGPPPSAVDRDQRRREDPDLMKLETTANNLKAKAESERLTLRLLVEFKGPQAEAEALEAAAAVDRLAAQVREAKAAVEACLVKADVAGVAERVLAAPGDTLGPAARDPVLLVVPAGRRVVRADVEAEFAPKVAGADGARVTVYDAHNFSLGYPGRVARTSTAYLPKRTAGDGPVLTPAKALECLVEVLDPAPPGKPPLRVGQPVRVSFP